MWAVGCIFAEMLGRKALFPGRDYLHQLRLIIDVLGTPSEEDLACITNHQAVQFLRTLPVKPRKPWTEIFPNASPQVRAPPHRPPFVQARRPPAIKCEPARPTPHTASSAHHPFAGARIAELHARL